MDEQFLEQGKILGKRYEILSFLGRGGFGETYLATDKLKMNSSCVIKRFKPTNPDPRILMAARKLFNREAEVLYQLGRHDQIPHLLAHFEENEEESGFYLAQEFIDGRDFNKELESIKKLSEAQVIELLYDVLNVLKFVHQEKVIHRDIKPSNLIRRQSDGKIVLIDFGAVKQISSQETTFEGLNASTIAIGTPGYMSNETQGGKPRYSSDIYALGMTAIFALTGKEPIQFEEDKLTGELIWRKYASTVDNRLATILDKMVKSHFRDRYKDADEVLKDLEKLRSSWKAALSKIISIPTVITGSPRKIASPPSAKLAGIKYVLLALVGLGAVLAIPKLYSFIPISPSLSAEELVKEGNTLNKSKEYTKALTTFNKALKLKSQSDEPYAYAWNGKGNALYGLEKYPEAITAYDEALKRKKDDEVIWQNKISTLIASENYDQAIATCQKALKMFDKSYTIWNYQGVAFFRLEQYQKALEAFKKSLGLDSENPIVWRNKGNSLYKLKDYDEAITAYTEALNREPQNFQFWLEKAGVQYAVQGYKDALYSLEEAIRLKPDSPEAWLHKGEVLYELKRYTEAVEAYDKALEIKPDYPEAKEARELVVKEL